MWKKGRWSLCPEVRGMEKKKLEVEVKVEKVGGCRCWLWI